MAAKFIGHKISPFLAAIPKQPDQVRVVKPVDDHKFCLVIAAGRRFWRGTSLIISQAIIDRRVTDDANVGIRLSKRPYAAVN